MRRPLFLFALTPLVLAACVSDLPAISDTDASPPSGPGLDAAADSPQSQEGEGGNPPSDAGNDTTIPVVDGGSDDASIPADSGSCFPRPNGIVSFYTGEDADDHGPAGNDLTWIGSGAPAFVPGKVGKAFSLNNTGLHAVVPKGLDGLGALSIEAWIQPATADGGVGPIEASFISRSTAGNGWTIWLKNWQMRFDMAPGTISYGQVKTIALGAFTHVAMTFDGNMVRFYSNGNLESATPIGDGGTLPVPEKGGDLLIGEQQGARPTFFGLIDELTIYSRAISKEEIRGIVKAGSLGKCPQ